jgi:hypothetical protein
VPSRFKEPSTAMRTFGGLLSRTPGPGIRTVDLGRVEVGDAEVQCAVDGSVLSEPDGIPAEVSARTYDPPQLMTRLYDPHEPIRGVHECAAAS